MEDAPPLPYRCGPSDLRAWLASRTRGRSRRQLRSAAGGSTKALEGAATTAAALGFWDADADAPTSTGEQLSVATAEAAAELLLSALLQYPPFRSILDAVSSGASSTVSSAEWIETWLAARGYGSSESNRREAVASLGRFVDHLALGRYVAGRRGHPTRIEWNLDALSRALATSLRGPPAMPHPPTVAAVASETATRPVAAAPLPPAPLPVDADAGAPRLTRLTLPLEDDLTVRVEVPTRLPAAQKRRLLQLLDLLITER